MDECWRTSIHSCDNGACVEVRAVDDLVEVRDSKDRSGPVLVFAPAGWVAFLDGARRGEFER